MAISVIHDSSTQYHVDEAAGVFEVVEHRAGALEFDNRGEIRRVRGAARVTRRRPMNAADILRYEAIVRQGQGPGPLGLIEQMPNLLRA